ncbi:DUF1501 domain-containing protein [Lignipirellula cremea]|uniref:Sulfatase n=1 Tax=Lignipirellula cremea TaxID=2528010 RepID=A0A518DUT7_9BACT|nr:DUF1501 domain-containing protein [Lignipirellula cremea]QDU95588.1 hypothetical protein Pla8534_34040 [Lignipirellula cremea]
MLKVVSNQRSHDCAGNTRRDFLRVGAIGASALTLPNLLRSRAAAAESQQSLRSKSVIWVWLSGGPTHVETFDPKMTAPVEFRSITGEAATPIPGVTIGGSFPKLASVADKMAIVRSFAHNNSSHGNGTQLVMTGYNDRADMRPSMGSIMAKRFGCSDPQSGMPTYVRMGNIRSDGPGWLGTTYSPFDPGSQASKSMRLSLDADRVSDRRNLLDSIDKMKRSADASGKMAGMDGFEQQAFELILGSSQEAFDTTKESKQTRDAYGSGLGESLLKARRLVEAGCGFVTLNYGGWDMHGGIEKGMKSRAGQVDQGVSALIADLHERGMNEDTLVVVTGEFGRTPKINAKGGRDHWGRLCTLALSGGGLKMGQVIGESSRKIEVPATTPITPQDLMATILQMYGVDHRMQFVNNSGRPVFLVEDGQPIAELV